MKLTTIRLLKAEARAGARPSEADWHDTAQLLAYCIQGREEFVACNGVLAAERAEDRLCHAIVADDSLDARLVLLTLHAGVIAPDIGDRFDLESG